MKLFGALILFLTVSTVFGLKCHTCAASDSNSCTQTTTCPAFFNRCYSSTVSGVTSKGCQHNSACGRQIVCCEGDLCNSAIPTGPSAIILLISSAIVTLLF